MWLLSGAVFPETGAPVWLRWVMRVNPLTYGVTAIRQGLYGQWDAGAVAVTAVFAVAMLVASLLVARRTTAGDLQ
jgi:ABC-2 type transport system permease protein